MTEVAEPALDPNQAEVALPHPAEACYRLFADVERIPEWLAVVFSAVVRERDDHGRPRIVAFLGRMQRSVVGYTCEYHFDDRHRAVTWESTPGSSFRVRGACHFESLGPRSCLMVYSLVTEAAPGTPHDWLDPFHAGHAPTATMGDFRDFVLRTLPPSS